MKRHEHRIWSHALGHHGLHVQARTGRRANPGALAIAYALVGSDLGVDLDKHFLLQLGKPRVGAGLLAAPFVFDKPARGHDQRKLLMNFVSYIFLLNSFVQGWQAPESFLVIVRRILDHQVGARAVQRFTVLGNGVREIPDHCPRFGIAEHMAAVVFHGYPDDPS